VLDPQKIYADGHFKAFSTLQNSTVSTAVRCPQVLREKLVPPGRIQYFSL
jgi:hypothetical protein